MKPLLIIPPCPARWPALADLLAHKGPPWVEDIEKRFTGGVENAEDAFAVIADGGRLLACACLSKCGEVGVLGHVFTRAQHRRRGYAHKLIKTLIGWFDMLGGKRLYLGCTTDLCGLYEKHRFQTSHRHGGAPDGGAANAGAADSGAAGAGAADAGTAATGAENVMMTRLAADAPADPFEGLSGNVSIRAATRRDWPALVALLQHRPGPDPRVSIDESATTAEINTLELFSEQDRNTCRLLVSQRAGRIVGLASVATDQTGERTYAMVIPHDGEHDALRAALVELGRSRAYAHVEFPMESLSGETADERR